MPSLINRPHLCLILILMLISACSRSPSFQRVESAADPRPEQVSPDQVSFSGSLSKNLREIQNQPHLDPCDLSLGEIKKFLVTAVEENQEKLNQSDSETVESSSTPIHPGVQARIIDFQGSHLIDLPKIQPDSTGWGTDLQGWGLLHDFYKQNSDLPTARFWKTLNQSVRSLLLEDKVRILNGTNRGIDHENVVHIPKISSVIESCLQDSQCETPRFNNELSLSVKSIPMYRFFDQGLRSLSSADSKRQLLKRFLDRTKRDLMDHSFRINPSLRFERTETATVLNLMMDPGLLGQAEKDMIDSIIESIWSSEKTRVNLEWGSKRQDSNLFEILFHPDSPYQRPFVFPLKKSMNLFPGNRTRSIAHEFGHVLGFSDHYYTVWDPDRCVYIYETNDIDLMSNSASGDVTPEEWQTLLNLEDRPAS